MSLEDVKKIFEKIPEVEIDRPIVSIEDKIYTWKKCKEIVESEPDSDLAQKIIEKIEEIIK